jgi:hypothetical protein
MRSDNARAEFARLSDEWNMRICACASRHAESKHDLAAGLLNTQANWCLLARKARFDYTAAAAQHARNPIS